MNMINMIEGGLYLGDWKAASKLYFLENMEIGRIISLGNDQEFEKYIFHDGIEYLKINVDDTLEEDISKHFAICNEFINNSKTNVLVHCHQGISRSATIVIAYLMSKNISFQEAYSQVKSIRPCIKPNDTFLHILKNNLLFLKIIVDSRKREPMRHQHPCWV